MSFYSLHLFFMQKKLKQLKATTTDTRLKRVISLSGKIKCNAFARHGRYAEPLIGFDLIGIDLMVPVLTGLVLIGL